MSQGDRPIIRRSLRWTERQEMIGLLQIGDGQVCRWDSVSHTAPLRGGGLREPLTHATITAFFSASTKRNATFKLEIHGNYSFRSVGAIKLLAFCVWVCMRGEGVRELMLITIISKTGAKCEEECNTYADVWEASAGCAGLNMRKPKCKHTSSYGTKKLPYTINSNKYILSITIYYYFFFTTSHLFFFLLYLVCLAVRVLFPG